MIPAKIHKKKPRLMMRPARDFTETVMERAAHDEEYRRGLLAEAVNGILEGNLDVGKAMLRDYINATITFSTLSQKLNKSSKSIHRMLGPNGNPRMDSIVGILKGSPGAGTDKVAHKLLKIPF